MAVEKTDFDPGFDGAEKRGLGLASLGQLRGECCEVESQPCLGVLPTLDFAGHLRYSVSDHETWRPVETVTVSVGL